MNTSSRAELVVTIPDKSSFYSLYADGLFSWKNYSKVSKETFFAYPENAALILYYTYPAYREACVVRNAASPSSARLPGLMKRVTVLFSVRASRVDKLKRAVSFLNKNHGGAYHQDDGFYTRLYFILLSKGKLDYTALRNLLKEAHV